MGDEPDESTNKGLTALSDTGNKQSRGSVIQYLTSTEFSSLYDYVVVFPMVGEGKKEQSPVAKFCITAMIEAGEDADNLSLEQQVLVALLFQLFI